MHRNQPTAPRPSRAAAVATVVAGALLVAPATALATEGESASGTIKIEEVEFNDPDVPNEVKAGCDFRIDFFGFEEQTVPITFTLKEPSGDDSEVGDVVAEREAALESARGNQPSGSLDVDITDDLRAYQPAQAEDFDYKLRADAVVKESEGSEVTKSAILFIDCPEAAAAAAAAEQVDQDGDAAAEEADEDGDAASEVEVSDDTAAADDEEAVVPRGGVDTGGGPAGPTPGVVPLALLAAGLLASGVRVARRVVTARQQ